MNSENKTKKLSAEDVKSILSLRDSGLEPTEIAKKFNISNDTVIYHLKKNGRTTTNNPAKSRRLSEEESALILRLVEEGQTAPQVAKRFGINKTSVYTLLKKHNKTDSIKKLTEITDEIYKQVCSLRSDLKYSLSEIADKVGIKESTVRYILGKAGVRLSSEDRIANQKRLDPALEAAIIAIRTTDPSATREQIAAKLGIKKSTVKGVLGRSQTLLDPERRQKNAYEAKLAKNPNAMSEMRNNLTSDVIVRRNVSIKRRYNSDDSFRKNQGTKSINWWASKKVRAEKYIVDDVKKVAEDLGLVVLLVDKEKEGLPNILAGGKSTLKCHCGRIWKTSTYDFLYYKTRSCGCVKSQNEMEIKDLVRSWGLECEKTKSVLEGLEIDCYVPSLKVGIEYCGLTWHGERIGRKDRSYHALKLQKAIEKGVRLITIFSDEWLTRKEQTVGYLKAILGKRSYAVGARECEVARVPYSQVKDFLNANHIQGGSGYIAYSLTYNKEVVAVTTFRKSSKKRLGYVEDGFYELVRYAVKIDWNVRGGLGKLLAAFKKDFDPKSILTFSDRRWSQGKLYTSVGFTHDGTAPISYWYFKKSTDAPRWHKSQFRKTKLGCLPNETEWDAAQRNNLDRIWDCGYDRWIWKIGN